MSNFPTLDIAIGLAFIYLLLSLISTTVNEMIAGWLKTRARFLEKGIGQLVHDDKLKEAIYQHPLIKSLSSDSDRPSPSYIPSDKFATALMDVVTGKDKSTMDTAALRNRLETVGSPEFQQSMRTLLDVAGDDPVEVKKKIEDWFNEGMDRVSGWYKRNTQRNILILAFIITLSMNADTLHVVDVLWKDPTTRAALVEQAKNRSNSQENAPVPAVEYEQADDPTASKVVSTNLTNPTAGLSDEEKLSLNQLTGWTVDWAHKKETALPQWIWWAIKEHWLGWILTAIALSLGAPFWFDTLNRFMSIRSAGKSPDEKRAKTAPAPAAQ